MNFFIVNLKWEVSFFQSATYFSCDRQPQVDDDGQERIGFMEQCFSNGALGFFSVMDRNVFEMTEKNYVISVKISENID